MRSSELKKQISIFVPLQEWRAIREEAARQKIPITELCRRWISPESEKLRRPLIWPSRDEFPSADRHAVVAN
ncbi:MAG: hypothetical protein U0903_22360 [Planctomycetales bacterium]